MSFAIIISEKGGAERRELFEKNEISVGRVQGNDLMLPKGNVSKRHAKLMFRDGRFIVADLKSTNGTYVNGRKIAQATIVREGDKIYVGDFVLRFEAAPGVVLAPESAANAPGPRDATAAELGQPSSAPLPLGGAPRDAVSHYPLENDPDEAAGQSPRVVVPSPPRMPSGLARGGTQMLGAVSQAPSAAQPPAPPTESSSASIAAAAASVVAGTSGTGGSGLGATVPRPAPPVTGTTAPPVPHAPHHAPSSPSMQAAQPSAAPRAPTPPVDSRPSREPSRPSRESSAHAAHRLALATLVDRIGEMIDLDPIRDGGPVEAALAARIERAVREQAHSLKADGEIPDGIDLEALARDAHRDILGLGPLGPLLDDDEVSVVHVARHDHVVATRGQTQSVVEPPFTSEEALRRALGRLCAQAGQPIAQGEAIVERRLARGSLLAVLPPLSVGGPVVTLRKRRREAAPEDAVRTGAASRAMWTFLTQCMAARLNVLLVGPSGPGLASLAGGLLAAAGPEERVAALSSPEASLPLPSTAAVFGADPSRADGVVRAASRMPVDRLVVFGLSGALSVATLEAIVERSVSVLAASFAPSARQALARLVPELCAARPGLPPDAAREWLASSFDLVVELGRLRDGRHRVLRVAEPAGLDGQQIALRDVFTFAADRAAAGGVIEGTFSATGHVPRFVDELRQRGVAFEPSLFDRQARLGGADPRPRAAGRKPRPPGPPPHRHGKGGG